VAGALESPKGHLPLSVVLGLPDANPAGRGAGNPRWYFRVLPAPYHI